MTYSWYEAIGWPLFGVLCMIAFGVAIGILAT